MSLTFRHVANLLLSNPRGLSDMIRRGDRGVMEFFASPRNRADLLRAVWQDAGAVRSVRFMEQQYAARVASEHRVPVREIVSTGNPLAPRDWMSPQAYRRWLLEQVARGNQTVIAALRDPGKVDRLSALLRTRYLGEHGFPRSHYPPNIPPSAQARLGVSGTQAVSAGFSGTVQGYEAAVRDARILLSHTDPKRFHHAGGPRPPEALTGVSRQWGQFGTPQRIEYTYHQSTRAPGDFSLGTGLPLKMIPTYPRTRADWEKWARAARVRDASWVVEMARRGGLSPLVAQASNPNSYLSRLAAANPQLRREIEGLLRDFARKQMSAVGAHRRTSYYGVNVPQGFTRWGGMALGEVSVPHLLMWKQRQGFIRRRYPHFYKALRQLWSQPWFEAAERRFEGEQGGLWSPADRDFYRDEYSNRDQTKRFMVMHSRDQDLFRDFATGDVLYAGFAITGAAERSWFRYTGYVPKGTPQDYRLRKKWERRRREYDPERFESLRRQDYWEVVVGGVPDWEGESPKFHGSLRDAHVWRRRIESMRKAGVPEREIWDRFNEETKFGGVAGVVRSRGREARANFGRGFGDYVQRRMTEYTHLLYHPMVEGFMDDERLVGSSRQFLDPRVRDVIAYRAARESGFEPEDLEGDLLERYEEGEILDPRMPSPDFGHVGRGKLRWTPEDREMRYFGLSEAKSGKAITRLLSVQTPEEFDSLMSDLGERYDLEKVYSMFPGFLRQLNKTAGMVGWMRK